MVPSDETLIDFVLRSNAIEGIRATEGPELEDHYHIARMVRDAVQRTNSLLSPKEIHAALMGRLLARAGEYRDVAVSLIHPAHEHDCRPTPRSTAVPQLMVRFMQAVEKFQALVALPTHRRPDVINRSNTLFFQGLCIHPFVDGNGRTFRLFHCQLRQLAGLPWLTYEVPEWHELLQQLRWYEDTVFVPMHRELYDA